MKKLRASQLKPKTLQLYNDAVCEFESWCIQNGRRRNSHRAIDEGLTQFTQELCEDARCFADASYAVFGWIALPEKDQLPFSKQSIKGWKSKFPPKSRAGVDLQLWDLVALRCAQQEHCEAAAAILLQGDTYLRPSELVQLKKCNVLQPQSIRKPDGWGVIIAPLEDGVPTKARDFDDVVLLNTPQRHDTNAVLKAVFNASKNSRWLFPKLTCKKYCEQIACSAKQEGLIDLRLTPRVLRHSGASHDAYYHVRDLQQIQERGRWKASRSVLRYKKPGRMLFQHGKVDSKIWFRARTARLQVVLILTAFFSWSS